MKSGIELQPLKMSENIQTEEKEPEKESEQIEVQVKKDGTKVRVCSKCGNEIK